MQIAREVGLNRIIRYIISALWQTIFNLLPLSPLRILWLRLFGATVGNNTVVDAIDFINLDRTGLRGLTISSRCFIGRGALLDLAGKITLENWVSISPRAIILSHTTVGFKNHPLLKLYPAKTHHTKINQGTFIGAGAIVLGGISVGPKSLVSAGAVVTRTLSHGSVVAGVPAVIKKTLKL